METALIALGSIAGGVIGGGLGLHFLMPTLNAEEAEAARQMVRNFGLGFMADII